MSFLKKFITNSAYSRGSPLNLVDSTFGKDGPCLIAWAVLRTVEKSATEIIGMDPVTLKARSTVQ